MLRRLENLAPTRHPDLLVGIDGADDAAVYRLDDDLALVQSVDFFTPIVDDAGDWGRIAAANALSDIYAMGARPLTALQLVGWPRDDLPFDLLGDVVAGGAEILEEARCLLVGGHSIDDREPKYGMAVTGLVRPDQLIPNRGALPGDALLLTKPIGTGLISTGIKRDLVEPSVRDEAVAVMTHLNVGAAAAMRFAGAKAATDVTGFGLLGHLEEMIRDGDIGVEITADAIPLLPGTERLARAGVAPGGTMRNLSHAGQFTDFGDIPEARRLILVDAQTSGGLLVALSPDQADGMLGALAAEGGPAAAVIGRFTTGPAGRIRVL